MKETIIDELIKRFDEPYVLYTIQSVEIKLKIEKRQAKEEPFV